MSVETLLITVYICGTSHNPPYVGMQSEAESTFTHFD